MDMPVSVSTIKIAEASANAGVQQANSARSGGSRDFAEVLQDSAPKSPSQKDKPARTDGRESTSERAASENSDGEGEAETSAGAATETAEPPAEFEVAMAGEAAIAPVENGNEVPLWAQSMLAAAAELAPRSPVTAAVATATLELEQPALTAIAQPVLPDAMRAPTGTPIDAPPDRSQDGRTPAASLSAAGARPAEYAPANVVVGDANATITEMTTTPAISAPTSERSALLMSKLESAFMSAPAMAPNQAPTSTAAASAAAPAPAQTSITLPLQHPQWQDAFAARVAWQVRDGLQQVKLAINPPELGPIEVRMSINDDRVSAQFVTQHHAVRQVIEDAMPRLRDMLSQSGLNLANADVSQHAPGRDGQAHPFADPSGNASDLAPANEDDPAPRSVRSMRVGLIDAYV